MADYCFQLFISTYGLSEVQLQGTCRTIFWCVHDQSGWNQDEILKWGAHKKNPVIFCEGAQSERYVKLFQEWQGRSNAIEGKDDFGNIVFYSFRIF